MASGTNYMPATKENFGVNGFTTRVFLNAVECPFSFIPHSVGDTGLFFNANQKIVLMLRLDDVGGITSLEDSHTPDGFSLTKINDGSYKLANLSGTFWGTSLLLISAN